MARKSRKARTKGAGTTGSTKPGDQTQPSSISISEFINRLNQDIFQAQNRDHEKHYALFLGAGCSVSSGIPTAGELVKSHWLPRLHEIKSGDAKLLLDWPISLIPGYDDTNPAASYGKVIDKLFLTATARQLEIEALCAGRSPSFGYAVLAQLVAHNSGAFNLVLTTNFDDLVADALYLFTRKRALVINHEALAPYIRPTNTRPLVVKLHGDHRLSPRNTEIETDEL